MAEEKREAMLHISPRFVKQGDDGLRPFQKQIIELLTNSDAKLIFVEAPVGSGKSHVIRKLLELNSFERIPLVFTYPTKILMETQVRSLGKDVGEGRVGVWPYTDFISGGINVFLYSSDSLLYYLRSKQIESIESRGRLIEKLFFDLQWHSKKGGVITSPDVLFLIYKEAYTRSKEIQNALANAIVIFDEFHLYSELKNFPILVDELLSKNVNKVVMLSATPFESTALKELKKRYSFAHIDFNNSEGSERDEIFNYPLNFDYYNFRLTNIAQTLEKITSLIVELPKPMAYISDSVFRLQHIKRNLLNQNFNEIEIVEWSGLEKDLVHPITEKTFVLGTSAIEVGIDMPFKSLIFEASYWTSAIQRLGRVGRKEAGTAVLLTAKDLRPYIKGKKNWERTSFEKEVLKEAFPNPREDLVFGDCFRGKNFNFLLFDTELNKYFIYHEALFSMYDIDDDYEYEWQRKSQDEKGETLREFRIPESEWETILLRDKLFPFWGVLTGKLAREYSSRPNVVYDEGRNELRILAKDHYVFYGGRHEN
ncbi:type I-D CRISPR-associated helicase Cas3' [candidate division WOR-3 bacterium]|nr:type I-D CRISPR-associated helicase Cas3' [candidate division WOR-3 bacterium]